ncbi:TPA: Glu-tRNA(Gln) amidotransferase subunit GatD [Candidatus Geothermarchaeota archaeon]|nr:Glu-tRNA(Gln) amidotransferase subunit GatD [Candidatus Geothermarchaeota archaeon]
MAMNSNLIDFYLRRKKLEYGDYVSIRMVDGSKYRGYIMPKHEFSAEDILVIKLDNGYNIGLRIDKIDEINREEPPKIREGVSLEDDYPQGMDLPNILVLGVGGTILSRVDYVTGAVRSAVSAEELLSILPEVGKIARIDTDIIMNKYSEHLTPRDWSIIAKTIYEYVSSGKYDGIVVLHGTDTLGYTAAALSFAIQNCPIPVILVGSQRSSDRPSSDAALNLISTIRIAGYADIAGVYVAMHGGTSDNIVVLHKGTRVRKNHTSRRDAFQSIDVEPILTIDKSGGIHYNNIELKRDPDRYPVLYPDFSEDVALVKFYPGMHRNILISLVNSGVKALIIEGTGLGHIGGHLFDTIGAIIRDGVKVFMTSQCIWGRVNMNVYDTGRILMKLGVVPLENMISETAYVKASWALGNFGERELVEIMRTNIMGEMIERSPIYGERGF